MSSCKLGDFYRLQGKYVLNLLLHIKYILNKRQFAFYIHLITLKAKVANQYFEVYFDVLKCIHFA